MKIRSKNPTRKNVWLPYRTQWGHTDPVSRRHFLSPPFHMWYQFLRDEMVQKQWRYPKKEPPIRSYSRKSYFAPLNHGRRRYNSNVTIHRTWWKDKLGTKFHQITSRFEMVERHPNWAAFNYELHSWNSYLRVIPKRLFIIETYLGYRLIRKIHPHNFRSREEHASVCLR